MRELPECRLKTLQWGRRVNTAECMGVNDKYDNEEAASMGPPREHGGMVDVDDQQETATIRFNGAAA